MRIAILSDIHANITALAAVVDDLKQQNVEALYCLGDISLQWTKKTVTLGRKAFLQSLKAEIRFEADGKRCRLVHGSPRRMNEYLFEDRPLSSFQRLAATSEADVLIVGHTHKPYTKRVDNVLFLNAGSIGKPKDGDPRACYVVSV